MILAKLNSLRELHSNSCVKSYLFQPNEDEQQKMITKNFASRLVSASVKKRIMLYKEQLREENLIRQRVQADNNSDSGHLVENMKNSESVREPGIQVKSHTHRIDNSQAMRRGSSFFINSLRKSMTFDGIDIILRYQALSWMRNTKAVFEALSTSYKPSITCKYDYRKGQEEIDASAIVSNLVAASSIKVEDPYLIKKKEGINIIMDPTFCSGNSKIGIAITYLKPIDLNNSEEVYRTYPAWSMTNNSFNLQLTQELTVAHSPPVECSLPGWNGRPPIFVPVAKCTIKIIIENEAGVDETTKYKLSNVTFFVWPSANVKAGMKKLNDFCETHFMKVVINAPLQGGLTALSTAALHGNLEAVIKLIANGASVNTRNKMSKYNTALHEAVIGGHREVVTYLLRSGANQVLKDENGLIPLHLACMLGDISIVKLLMNADKAKKALLMVNNKDKKALDLCKNDYLKARVEDVMRKLGIFAKPRISLVER